MPLVADLANAEGVILAHELAELGASPQLIDRLTGFGERFSRGIVRCKGDATCTHRRKDDPAKWFDKDSERILHGSLVVKAFWATVSDDHRAKRVIDAFNTYRQMNFSPILTVVDCADIIDLAECGLAWERTCATCRQRHLMVSEHSECPVCRRLRAMLCNGCGVPLPEDEPKERRGRPRQYCAGCESKRSDRVLKTDRQRRLFLHDIAS